MGNGTTTRANYLVIKAIPSQYSTLDSVSANYPISNRLDSDKPLYWSKGVDAEGNLYDDYLFEDNFFIYSIKDQSAYTSDTCNVDDYMQFNTDITLVFTSDTWLDYADNEDLVSSGKEYHIDSSEQTHPVCL